MTKTMDIGSLDLGLDGLVFRWRIGRKGLWKTAILFSVHSLFHCEFCSHCTCEPTHCLAYSVCTLPLILLVSLTSHPFLHSVAHYTRLVIPGQFLHIA
jgi:hypothetical protein